MRLSRNLARWASKAIPVFDPVAYFAGGGLGSWYDPNDLTTMYQDDKGQTPAALNQQVGLMFDKSKVMALSRVATYTFADGTGVTPGGSETITGGKLVISPATSNICTFAFTPTIGKLYKVTYTISGYSTGSIAAQIGGKTGTSRSTNGTFVDWLMGTATTALKLLPSSFVGSIDDVLVDEVLGCHVQQATAASRPYLRQSAGGIYYLESDGIDDVFAGPTNGTAYPASAAMKHYIAAAVSRGTQDSTTILQIGATSTNYHRLTNTSSSNRVTFRAQDASGIGTIASPNNSFPLNTPTVVDTLIDGSAGDVFASGVGSSTTGATSSANSLAAGLITIGAAALALQFYGHISVVGGVSSLQRAGIRKWLAAHTGAV